MRSANQARLRQIGRRRTWPTAEQPATVEESGATQFAQALQAAFHRRLRKCSLNILRDELVRRRLLRKRGDEWELTAKGKKQLAEAQHDGDRPTQ